MPTVAGGYHLQRYSNSIRNKINRFRKSMYCNRKSILRVFLLSFALCLPILTYLTIGSETEPVSIRNFQQSTSIEQGQFEPSNLKYVDPCSIASPQLIKHFDPSVRFSHEFHNTVESDVDPPALDRIFTAFFKKYLFQPTSDIIVNLNATGRGRPTDIRDGLIFAQSALQRFYNDTSIEVNDYLLGYSHLDRVRGSRYIFHLKSSSENVPERRDVAVLQRTFDGQCYVSVRNYDDQIFQNPVYMLVPYSKRPKRLKWFLKQFDELIGKGSKVKLVLAICKENKEDLATSKILVSRTKHSSHIQIIPVPGDKTGFFSRSISIRDGSEIIPQNSIMFISDVDMYLFPPLFESCRYNAIQGSQIYVPVFYSLFARGIRIDKDSGYWRISSHGMSCVYKSDFDKVGPYEDAERSFLGWGGEDLAMSEAFVNHSDYEVFRAIEPALRHKWHMKHCEKFTPAYEDCLSISFKQLGSMSSVGRYLIKQNIDTQSLYAKFADQDDISQDLSTSERDDNNNDLSTDSEEDEKTRKRAKILRRTYDMRKARVRRLSMSQ